MVSMTSSREQAFVDEDKAARIGETGKPLSILSHHAGDPTKTWDEHREFGWQGVLTLWLSIFPHLGDVHRGRALRWLPI